MARPLIRPNKLFTDNTHEFVSSDWLRQLYTSYLGFKSTLYSTQLGKAMHT